MLCALECSCTSSWEEEAPGCRREQCVGHFLALHDAEAFFFWGGKLFFLMLYFDDLYSHGAVIDVK